MVLQGIRSPGNRGELLEGKVKPDPKRFVVKQGWGGKNRKARGERICLGRRLREGTWCWHGNVSRPMAAVRGGDGLTIQATADYLRTQWSGIREALQDGSYRP